MPIIRSGKVKLVGSPLKLILNIYADDQPALYIFKILYDQLFTKMSKTFNLGVAMIYRLDTRENKGVST